MSSEEKTKKSPTSELLEQAICYFKKAGYKIEHKATTLEGFCGVSRKFDLIVQKGNAFHGVWVRDWKRTIGINVVISLDKASEDAGLANPIIIGEKFSDHVKSYANRRKIILLTKQQILTSLR